MIRNILILFTILSFVCCKKDKVDYRDKYIGNYKCYRDTGWYSPSQAMTSHAVIVVVNVAKSSSDSLLILGAQYKLNNNGNFENGLVPPLGGYFRNDSIYFWTESNILLTYKGIKL